MTNLHCRLFGGAAWFAALLLTNPGCGENADSESHAVEQKQARTSAAAAGGPASAPASRVVDVNEQALRGGSCSTWTENGGHTAVGHCSGYLNTGTFQVTAMCCLTRCSGPVGGNRAFKSGGTSKAGCGSAYASDLKIVDGPPGG
jgi:hypothetical protein